MHRSIPSAARQQAHRGFTLIELTVVLAVIVTLALILTPSIANFVNDSRMTRAQTDCQQLGTAIIAFYRDTGFFPQWNVSQGGGAGKAQSRIQVLSSSGNQPLEEQSSLWTTGSSGMLADQLLSNIPGYALRSASQPSGWNGPYLSSDLRGDPWGNRYLVNIGLIDTAPGAVSLSGQMKMAVWVLSAGPNGTIETPYTQPVTAAMAGGDDVVFRIQ